MTFWAALEDDIIDTIATDHAPHPLEAKSKPYFDAPSGIPSIQHSLQMMLEAAISNDDLLTMIVQKMCHNPATLFGIKDRGFIRKGYKADLVLARTGVEETVTKESLLSKCGWSPLEGQTFHTHIESVYVNGDTDGTAEQLVFSK